MIWDHHRRAVQNWVDHCQTNPEFLAVIFAGSLTKGYGLESSDVDGWIIVTDAEFQRRQSTGTLHWFNRELVDYEGGYIDAKCVPLSFLHEVDRHGSEPARSAFQGAEVPWSQIEGLPELCQKILRYPEEGLVDRQKRFISQLRFANWFTGEAIKRGNRYLLLHATTKLVLFSTRLLLSENRILYPYHKWMLRALQDAPLKPEGTMDLIESLLSDPSAERASALADAVIGFRPWPEPEFGWPNQVIVDSEWPWMHDASSIDDI